MNTNLNTNKDKNMGAFSGLRDASRGFSSNMLRAGTYILRIDDCDSFEAEQKGRMWKNTMTVLAVIDGAGNPHKVGEQVNVFYKKGQYPKLFLQNVKGFIANVLGVQDEEVGEEEADEILGENNPMEGLVTRVTGRMQASKTKKDSKGDPEEYPVFSWGQSMDADEIREAIGDEAVERFFPNGL